jgi:hypothetical protein
MDKKKKEDEEEEEEGGGKAKQHHNNSNNNNNNSRDFDGPSFILLLIVNVFGIMTLFPVANGSNGVHVHRVPQIPSESPRRFD